MQIFKSLQEAKNHTHYDFSFIFFKNGFIKDRCVQGTSCLVVYGPVIVYDVLPEGWEYQAASMYVDFFKLRVIDEIIKTVSRCSSTYTVKGDANRTFVRAYAKTFDSTKCKIPHSITKTESKLQILFKI